MSLPNLFDPDAKLITRTISPEQKIRIDNLTAKFDSDWEVDIKERRIKRKDRSFCRKVLEFFWPNKHGVFALYWWCKKKWHGTDLMVFKFPIKHDNMPISGFPMKYEMLGNWNILDEDLKFLKDGPLARISANEILIPQYLGMRSYIEKIKPWIPMFTLIGAFLTIVLRFTELSSLLITPLNS